MEWQPLEALGALVEGVTDGVGATTGVAVLGLAVVGLAVGLAVVGLAVVGLAVGLVVVGEAGPAWQNAL